MASGDSNVGPFVGYNFYEYPMISNCFWKTDSGFKSGNGDIDISDLQMKTLNTFTSAGWDFIGESDNGSDDPWRLCADGLQYPKLNWQFAPDFLCPDGVDLRDLSILASRWNDQGDFFSFSNLTSDLNHNYKVDYLDLAILSRNWLTVF